MPPRHRCGRPTTRPKQRGAATLMVVMVLFFIVALVAAYTSRNLIFEQRTSANQYRSTQALEAAEAGIEWALTMLNSGRIDAACQPLPDPDLAGNSFRQRYLSIDPDTGVVAALPRSDGQPLRPSCVFNGTDWQCSCALDPAAPALAVPAGSGPFPAFTLRFSRNDPVYPPVSPAYPPGVVRIESTGCTRLDAAGVCAAAASSGDGRATVTVLAALKSALPAPPTAAVTVRLNLDRVGSANLIAVNSDSASSGITVHSGRPIIPDTWLIPYSRPGTPGDQSFVENDLLLAGLSSERMFASVFGMARSTYRLQPATVYVDCAVDCTAATVRDMARLNPGRMLWIEGNFDINVAGPIGTAASPAMLVVNGNTTVSLASAQINGVVYSVGASWSNDIGMTLNGALVAEANLRLSGTEATTVVYDAATLNLLNRTSGSFVRVPGSWRDF